MKQLFLLGILMGFIVLVTGCTANKDVAKQASGFQMIMDEDGIWNVAFMPIQ